MSPRPLTMLRPDILPLSDRNLSTCSSGIDPNPHKKRVAKSVCFVSTVDIYPVLHRRDMTIEEVQKTWFLRLERRQSRTAVENTIFLMRTGIGAQLTEDDHFCSLVV
ncbi:hypothetical protein IV203_029669 [Nitzschia inconspicua]|uniref:Uncharacterized protein n=1 Tax=Nitzschia inconspicua TaxID=303405 RepID=A0A9K3LS94_9STRA|nr:hypothetical protein IV203_029669 [Nitzschia inconspicua]